MLRNFSNDGATVRTVALETGTVIPNAPIKGQCAENYFYGRIPDMENAFETMENNVATLLRRAASHDATPFAGEYRCDVIPEDSEEWQRLQHHPLYAIREFVYYQARRTVASAQSFTKMADAEAKWWIRRDPTLATEHPEVIEHLDDVVISLNDPMAHILYGAGPVSFGIVDLTVKLLVLDEPGFILSDHPVATRNQFAEATRMKGPGRLDLSRGVCSCSCLYLQR